MYSFSSTVLVFQTREDLTIIFFLGLSSTLDSFAQSQSQIIISLVLSSYTVHETYRFTEIPFGWKVIMQRFL